MAGRVKRVSSEQLQEVISDQRLLGAMDAKIDGLLRDVARQQIASDASSAALIASLNKHTDDDMTRFSVVHKRLDLVFKWVYIGIGMAILVGMLVPIYLRN